MAANSTSTPFLLTNYTHPEEVAERSSHLNASSLQGSLEDLRQTFVVTYLVTFVLGVAGNGLVIYIIGYYSEVRRKSVANYYIWNLSFADLFFVLTLPFFCFATLTKDWPFGDFVCKMSYTMRETNKFSSVFTLVALSVDRYLASFYSLGHLRTVKVGVGVCGGVWLLCILLSLPYWLYSHTITMPNSQTSCRITWPGTSHLAYQKFWIYFQLLLGLIVPFTIILICYCGLAARLRHILKSGPAGRRRKIQKPSRRMTKTVLVVVLTFLFCQTPYYVMEILNLQQTEKIVASRALAKSLIPTTLSPLNTSFLPKLSHPTMDSATLDHLAAEEAPRVKPYQPSMNEIRMYIILTAMAKILVFISSCCNPIIYGLLNENYRTFCNVQMFDTLFYYKCSSVTPLTTECPATVHGPTVQQ